MNADGFGELVIVEGVDERIRRIIEDFSDDCKILVGDCADGCTGY